MKKVFDTIFVYGLALLAFETLCILGAEPSGTGEEALANYETSIQFWGPIILTSWCITLICVIVAGIFSFRLEKNNPK